MIFLTGDIRHARKFGLRQMAFLKVTKDVPPSVGPYYSILCTLAYIGQPPKVRPYYILCTAAMQVTPTDLETVSLFLLDCRYPLSPQCWNPSETGEMIQVCCKCEGIASHLVQSGIEQWAISLQSQFFCLKASQVLARFVACPFICKQGLVFASCKVRPTCCSWAYTSVIHT